MRFIVAMLAVAALCVAPLAIAGSGCANAPTMAAENMVPDMPAFARIDANADAQLTAAELDGFIEAYPEFGSMKDAFAKIDVDQDGVVTVSEYDAWLSMTDTEEDAEDVME